MNDMNDKKKDAEEFIHNPELYYRLLAPFPSKEAANDACENFYKDLRVLREKYGLPDLAVVIRQIYKEEEAEHDELIVQSCGDTSLVSTMLSSSAIMAITNKIAKIEIPHEFFESSTFYTKLIMLFNLAASEKDAMVLIKSGKVKVNGVVQKFDDFPPFESSVVEILSFRIVVPGTNDIVPGVDGRVMIE